METKLNCLDFSVIWGIWSEAGLILSDWWATCSIKHTAAPRALQFQVWVLSVPINQLQLESHRKFTADGSVNLIWREFSCFNKNTTICLLTVFDLFTKLLDFSSKQIRVRGTFSCTNSLSCSLDHNMHKLEKGLFVISCELKNILLTTSQPCSRTEVSGFIIRMCHFKLSSCSSCLPVEAALAFPFHLLPKSQFCCQQGWSAWLRQPALVQHLPLPSTPNTSKSFSSTPIKHKNLFQIYLTSSPSICYSKVASHSHPFILQVLPGVCFRHICDSTAKSAELLLLFTTRTGSF